MTSEIELGIDCIVRPEYIFFMILFLTTIVTFASLPWGFYAHKKANRYAVFTLPEELIGFYKKNIDYITEHSVDADKRRYAIKQEAPRHYIDIDVYVMCMLMLILMDMYVMCM